jgi:hypothetical protein
MKNKRGEVVIAREFFGKTNKITVNWRAVAENEKKEGKGRLCPLIF